MKSPRRAIVLAAGFGSRLSPLTLECPKPLVPLHGKPMILHLLEQLQSWGVKEVLLNVHHLADVMVQEVPRICPPGLNLNFSFESEILGTGGGLRKMAWFFSEEPLWVCNADVWQQLDPTPLVEAWNMQKPMACLWMIPDAGPRTVQVESGLVKDFRAGGMTFSGLHLLNQKVLSFLPDQNFSSIIEAYDAGLAKGEKIAGVTLPDSEWADIGTPEQLLMKQGGPVFAPGVKLRKGQQAVGIVVSPDSGLTDDERRRLPQVEAVEILPARGSDRSFRRLFSETGSQILVKSGEMRPENNRFVGHTRFLHRNGIRTPHILKQRQQGRWLQVEDLGQVHLLDRLNRASTRRNKQDMRKVLELVARFHALKPPASLKLEPAFGPDVYAWEHELFKNEFLKRHGKFSELRNGGKFFFRLSEKLCEQPQVLVHRDLQSTNIMWTGNQPALIDYQGMRLGAAAYDLGSLLADPYVNRPKALQVELLEIYNGYAEIPVSETELAVGSVQRLMQALGAYGRLGAQKQNRRFLQHIPAALQQLSLWAETADMAEWLDNFYEGQMTAIPLSGKGS